VTGDNRKPKPKRRVRKIERRAKAVSVDQHNRKLRKGTVGKTRSLWAAIRRLFRRRKYAAAQQVELTTHLRAKHNVGPLPTIDWSTPDHKGEMVGYGRDGNIYIAYLAKGHLGYAVSRVLVTGHLFYMGVYPIPSG